MTDLWWTLLPKGSLGEVCPRLARAQEFERLAAAVGSHEFAQDRKVCERCGLSLSQIFDSRLWCLVETHCDACGHELTPSDREVGWDGHVSICPRRRLGPNATLADMERTA